MDSQEPTIEEKLVPFVEGALAEADRREVLQALPNSPELTQEVRQLKDIILALRTQASKGMTYRSAAEAPPEQVVDFALQSEQWSRQSSRQFQLHMLESPSLAEEIEILRELEEDLQQRVEAARPVPEMPGALRAAIAEAYGRPAPEPVWKKTVAAMVAWMAGMNLKVAAAACVLVVGGLGVGRLMHQQMSSTRSAPGYAVSESGKSLQSTATPTAPAPAPPPAGQVALLKEQVHPEDLPRLSRLLWQKQVSHSYRDGQIYVAQADYDKAWTALQINEKIALAQPLETRPLKDDKKTDLDGGIIGTPDADPARPVAKKEAGPSLPSRPVAGVEAKKSDYRGADTPRPAPAVAVGIPAPPEASRGPADDANQNVSVEPEAPRSEPVRSGTASAATRPVAKASERERFKDAPPATQAPYLPPRQSAVEWRKSGSDQLPSYNNNDSGPFYKNKTVEPSRKQQAQTASPPSAPPVEPVVEIASNAKVDVVEPVAPPVQPISRPAPPVAAPNKAPLNKEARQEQSRVEEEDGTPAGHTVQRGNFPTTPTMENMDKVANRRDRSSADELASQGKTAPTMAQSQTEQLARPGTKMASGETNVVPRAAGGRAVEGQAAARPADNESFDVKGNAPFEVAMLPVAKKLVEDLVGEAKVQMERKEDGHLKVTIRPARSLSPEEVDKLRKVVREKLELQEEDTVVIRQP